MRARRQMDMFATGGRYPAAPGYKAPGPSREAARRIAPVAKGVRGRVLQYFRECWPNGRTVDELTRELQISPFTARPRVSELHASGLIESTAARRPNESGHAATVWRASAKGLGHD